jgi:hypothetical protein
MEVKQVWKFNTLHMYEKVLCEVTDKSGAGKGEIS